MQSIGDSSGGRNDVKEQQIETSFRLSRILSPIATLPVEKNEVLPLDESFGLYEP